MSSLPGSAGVSPAVSAQREQDVRCRVRCEIVAPYGALSGRDARAPRRNANGTSDVEYVVCMSHLTVL